MSTQDPDHMTASVTPNKPFQETRHCARSSQSQTTRQDSANESSTQLPKPILSNDRGFSAMQCGKDMHGLQQTHLTTKVKRQSRNCQPPRGTPERQEQRAAALARRVTSRCPPRSRMSNFADHLSPGSETSHLLTQIRTSSEELASTHFLRCHLTEQPYVKVSEPSTEDGSRKAVHT